MRLLSGRVQIKGLRWEGSLGLLISFTFSKEAAGPQNKLTPLPLESTVVRRNSATMEAIRQSHGSHMLVTTGRQLPFPRVQIVPNSAVGCLHFALTYGETTTGEDHALRWGEFWQSHSSTDSGGVSSDGNDTDKDQAKSPQGSTARCGEKLFSTVLIYWSMTSKQAP